MLSHNSYFDGNVQSLGFERHGKKTTVGVMAPGSYHFNTGAPERITVISGSLQVELPGESTFQLYPRGTAFEVPGDSGFDLEVTQPSAYLCEFL
jgi:uncharacterized protein YaiE (UPF0345 family)